MDGTRKSMIQTSSQTKAHDSFLQQSYLDNWNDYQYLLGRNKAMRWNWFIVTASNEEQARTYEMQINYRLKQGWLPHGTRYAVIPDPEGKRVGSGGATLNVLRYIREHSSEADPYADQRILVLHSGGDSKRVPQFSACGKLFSRVPRELPDGRSSTLFDEFVIALSSVPSRMSDGMLVMSGDVLLLFNPLQIDLQRIGSACISIKAPVEVGSHHGVFLPDREGNVQRFLHKLTPEQLRAAGAVNEQDHVDIDSGAIWMGSDLVRNLSSLIESPACHGEKPIINEKRFSRFVNDTLRLSFYGDFVYPMVTDAQLETYLKEPAEGLYCEELEACRRELWPVLHASPMHLVRLSPARFIHFGTTRELHRLMLSASAQYGYLGWQNQVMSSGHTQASCINSVIEQGARVSTDVYLEDCHLLAGADVQTGCVISNATVSGALNQDTVLHGLPVFFGSEAGWVLRIYGLGDNPKLGLLQNGTFLGSTLQQFLESNHIGEADLWTGTDRSLWTAHLYPFCASEQEAMEWAMVLQRMSQAKASQQEVDASHQEVACWLSCRRLSLQESFESADMSRVMSRQEDLEDRVRTLQFLNALCDAREPVQEAAVVLGIGSSLERRLLLLASQADALEFSSRIRVLRAISYLCREMPVSESVSCESETTCLNPEAYEDLCWQTLNQTILDSVRDDLLASGKKAGSFRVVKDADVALPVRINWGGGWTDTPPYCLEHGGTVLNAAISLNGELPVKVSVRLLDEPVIRLESRDLKMVREYRNLSELVRCDNLADPLSIHKAALRVCGILPEVENAPKLEDVLSLSGKGFLLSTSVNVPKGSGLGTSSILAGALVKALTIAMDLPVHDARLFDQVLCMEQLMTTGGGWQDQVGGLVPGIKMISSRPGLHQELKVENLSIPEDARHELEERFVLVFTGQRRLARNILREVVGRYLLNNPESLQILDRAQEVAALMRFELERGNIDRFAHLLNEHWGLSCSLDAGTTNTCINQIIEVCKPLVDGVFIAGAGGGGFMQMVLSRGASRTALKERLMSVFQDINIEVWETGFVW
jgi:fucokinase